MAGFLPRIVGGTLNRVLAHPALVGYQKSGQVQHVGRFSGGHEESKISVSLFICCDMENDKECLIYLNVPFTRPNWKFPRDVYLVLPVEDLQLETTLVDAGSIPHVGTEHLLNDGLKPTDKVLQIAFKLGRSAFAVMPALPQPLETLEPLQCRLLLHWRDLSTSTAMDAYFSDTSLVDVFRNISTNTREGRLTTPKLDWKNMYKGCKGAKNNWDQYPYKQSANDNNLTWNPCLDLEPPPYNDVAPRPPTLAFAKRVEQLEEPSSSAETQLIWANTPPPFDSDCVFKDTGPFAREKRKATERPEEGPYRSSKARKLMEDIEPGTPTERDSVSSSTSAINIPAAGLQWGSQLTEMKEAIRSSLRRRRAHVSKTDNPDYTPLAAPCLDIELQELILEMWNYDQFAHDVFRDQLLNLGFLASRLIVVRFDAAKVAVQKAFLKRSASMLVAHRFRPADLEADATRLLEWLEHRVCRNATRLLTDELRNLF